MTSGSSGDPVVGRIRSEIEASGPMPFDRFMELTLYGPDGYFRSNILRSQRDGDFLTSPEVSSSFGTVLANAVIAERERVGVPFTVAEIGAGSGSLLQPLVEALEPAPDRVIAVEVSPAARRSLMKRLPLADVVESLHEIAGGVTGVILANELLDNLPAALVVRRGPTWRERAVDVSAGELVWVEVEARTEAARWADAYGGRVPEGGQVEVQGEAGRWLLASLDRLFSGAVIVIDYGDTAEGLEHRRLEGTLRTYRDHHLGPDPLSEPGLTDVTMDVNFTALASVAAEHGAVTELWRQDEYLAKWRLLEHIAELKSREHQAAAAGTTMERLRWRNLVTGAEALLHPRGLGDFRVLVARV